LKDPRAKRREILSEVLGIHGSKTWLTATVMLIQFFLFPALVFAFEGRNARLPGPMQPEPLQIAIAVASTLGAIVVSRQLLTPKFNEAEQRVLLPFESFVTQFTIIGVCAAANALIGIFTGKGPQVYMGMGVCYVLLITLMVPVYFKMRSLYRAATSTSQSTQP